MQNLFLLIAIFAGFGLLYYLLSQKMERKETSDEELERLVNEIFGRSAAKITQQSQQVLAAERKAIDQNLEHKQKALEQLIKTLQDELKTRQDEIRELEKDRNLKFSAISTSLKEHQALTKELQVSTQALSKVLDNNQTRGAWGERIIEDLLESNGLQEGIHYLRQSQLGGNTSQRPDITLLLPDDHRVAVDVKFPYQEMQKMAVAESTKMKQAHLKQFVTDVKLKIKKVSSYINPEENTLDYAILFVPNEALFSYINQKLPDLVDEAFERRVIIVSPFTFMAVARTLMESYRTFMMEKNLKEIINYVHDFRKEWGIFKEEFAKFGRSIETLRSGFEKLSGTRTNVMERKISRIEQYQLGSGPEQES